MRCFFIFSALLFPALVFGQNKKQVDIRSIHPNYCAICWLDLPNVPTESCLLISSSMHSFDKAKVEQEQFHNRLVSVLNADDGSSGATRIYWLSRQGVNAPDEYRIMTTNLDRTREIVRPLIDSERLKFVDGKDFVSILPVIDQRDFTFPGASGTEELRQKFLSEVIDYPSGWVLYSQALLFPQTKRGSHAFFEALRKEGNLEHLMRSLRNISCVECPDSSPILQFRLRFYPFSHALEAADAIKKLVKSYAPGNVSSVEVDVEKEQGIVTLTVTSKSVAIQIRDHLDQLLTAKAVKPHKK